MNNDNNVLFSFLPCFDYAYKGFGPIINTVIQGYTVAHFYLNFLSVYIYSNSSEKNMIWKTKMNVYSSYTLQFFLIKHILRARDPLATPCLFLFSTPSRVPSSLWINLSQPFFCYVYSLSKSFLSFSPPLFSFSNFSRSYRFTLPYRVLVGRRPSTRLSHPVILLFLRLNSTRTEWHVISLCYIRSPLLVPLPLLLCN